MRIYTHPSGYHYVNALWANTDPEHGRNYQLACGTKILNLNFQGGPIGAGYDDLLNEQLLAVLYHRIETLQARKPCPENVHVLHHLAESLALLQCREQQAAA
jgi:hypothetical protein